MSDKAVDLAQLRQRLAKLGVHITEPGRSENLVSTKAVRSRECCRKLQRSSAVTLHMPVH